MPTTRRPTVVFAGLDPGAPIGARGARSSAAPPGFEVDNHDPVLGSPADAAVLASATVGTGVLDLARRRPRRLRRGAEAARRHGPAAADRRAGAVFSVGSIAWTGCLVGDDDNPVARVTENVLARARARASVRGRRCLSGGRGARTRERFDVGRRRRRPQRARRRGLPRPRRAADRRRRAPPDRRRRLHDRGVRARVPSLAGRLRAQPPATGDLARLLAARPRARGARGGADAERVSRRRPADPARRRAPRPRASSRASTPPTAPRSPRFSAEMLAIAGLLGPWFDRPPPGAPGWLGRGSLRALARSARRGAPPRPRRREAVRDLGPRVPRAALPLRARARGARLGRDLEHARRGRRRPGPPTALLHEHAASALGGQTWGFVRGGMGEVTGLLADAAREAGAEIRTEAEVESDRGRGRPGRGRAARLAARRSAATTVLSNADPKRTLLGLVEPRPASTRDCSRRSRAYRSEGASMKINLAVGELPRIAGTPAGPQPHHRGLIQLTLPLAGDGPRPGERPRRGPGRGPARRALRAERARPVAGAAGAPRRHARACARSPTGSPARPGTSSASGSPIGSSTSWRRWSRTCRAR